MANYFVVRWRKKTWSEVKDKYKWKADGWTEVVCVTRPQAERFRNYFLKDPKQQFDVEIVEKC